MLNQKLNVLLSDLVVFYHKLQSYHWFVKGHAFFNAHAKLEEYYDGIRDQIDEIAELALMSGMKPVSRMTEFAELSQIREASGDYVSVSEVFGDVRGDFSYLLDSVSAIKVQADEEGKYLISAKMDEIAAYCSKAIWMLSQSSM
ncbi:MAG: Dps family protein [Stomatobaculum sp.]